MSTTTETPINPANIAPGYLALRSALCKKYKCEKKAAKAFVKLLSPEEYQRLSSLVDECRFTRRKYPGNQFYCWALHPIFITKGLGVDPYPAVNFPRACLMMDFAIRTQEPASVAATLRFPDCVVSSR
jgi:hypothetical protein